MKDKGSLALLAVLTLALSFVWLNATHLIEAIVRLQPGLPPRLTTHGLEILQKGAVTPIVQPIMGFMFSAGFGFCLAFRNLVVTERPWLRMGMFVGLIGVVLAAWWALQMKLMIVNPSNISDPEIAAWTRTGTLSLQVTFERGTEPASVSFTILLLAYTLSVAALAYPESRSNSSEQGVQSSLRR